MTEPFEVHWADDGGMSWGPGYSISWQRGPLEKTRNGALLVDLLVACMVQIRHYQKGKFACDENAIAQQCLHAAIAALRSPVAPVLSGQNWVTDEGFHDGGVSYGIGYSIAWQRGPLVGNGRNGAFLLDVLKAIRGRTLYETGNPAVLLNTQKAIAILTQRLERRRQEGTLGTTKV